MTGNDLQNLHFGTADRLFNYELNQWIKIVNQSAEEWNFEDVPWWYKERAQLSLFAGTIWRTGGSVFEEFGMTKKHKDRRYSGRCDFYCRTADNKTFLAEAKHAEIVTTDGKAEDNIRAALKLAKSACARCTPEEEEVIAIVFLTLVIPKNSDSGANLVDKIINRFCESIRNVAPTSAAWVFPKKARAYPTADGSQHYQPGGAILIESVRPAKLRPMGLNPAKIQQLLDKLASFPSSDNVNNQYRNPAQLENVQRYVEALCALPSCECLLVGESPGHRGCAKTGIPFTSEEVIITSNSAFLQELRPKLKTSGLTNEQTAKEVWRSLGSARQVPALWNIFPFHAHEKGKLNSNRKPTPAEAHAGLEILELVKQILNPKQVVAVGRVAQNVLAKNSQNVSYVRHPARNGGDLFRKGLGPLLGT